MRKVAASRVYINEKEFHNNYIVELFEHHVVRTYPLETELPMTEWLGGTIIIRGQEAFHIPIVLSPAELSAYDGSGNSHIQRL